MPSKNILMISIDDLSDIAAVRDLYDGVVQTPHLDALMDQGTTFSNAFAQTALCNPSRASILTGQTPNSTGILDNSPTWYDVIPAEQTLPAVLKAAGYQTAGVGKIFHTTNMPEDVQNAIFDEYYDANGGPEDRTDNRFSVEPYTGDPAQLRDHENTDWAIDFLDNYPSGGSDPFFLSVGLFKPHQDWVAPKEFFDLYSLSKVNLPPHLDGDLDDVPAFIKNLMNPDYHQQVLDAGYWPKMIQGYLATVSYLDAMIGRVLDALADNDLEGNTSIVLWSDHGNHHGDKEEWGKFTLWEEAGKAPLIIVDPDIGSPGQTVDQVVELVDIFPTILDLAGLGAAPWAEGDSLTPLLNNVNAPWDNIAVTQMYGSFSVRSESFRYIRYEDSSEELYDIVNDPDQFTNLAKVDSYRSTKNQLKSELRDYADAHDVLLSFGDKVTEGTDAAEFIVQGKRSELLAGGAGDDAYTVVNDKVNVIEELDEGLDTVITGISYVLPEGVEQLLAKNGTAGLQLEGNALDNFVSGGAGGADTIYGLGGNDTLLGGSGRDTLYAGTGNDVADGGSANDWITGEGGNDSLRGGEGTDTLLGGAGRDLIEGNSGDDALIGGSNDDWLEGGAGNDSLKGGRGADSLYGQTGSDTLKGGDGDDAVDGGPGKDTLYGGVGNDTLHGGGAKDVLMGNGGNDVVDGGDGKDSLIGNHGDDTLTGGNGDDTLDGSEGADSVSGGAGDDIVNGNSGHDDLLGGDGNDLLRGNWGNDSLEGGFGEDTLLGGPGDDPRLFGGDGDDLIIGDAGDDFAVGGNGDDTLKGGEGDDRLRGNGGEDWLEGGPGNDYLFGGSHADRFVFWGQNGSDKIADFQNGIDAIDFTAYAVDDISDFDIDQTGGRTVISNFGGGTVMLMNFDADGLDDGDFLFN